MRAEASTCGKNANFMRRGRLPSSEREASCNENSQSSNRSSSYSHSLRMVCFAISQSLIKVSQSQGIYNIFQKIVIIFLKQAFKVSDNLQYRDNLLSG